MAVWKKWTSTVLVNGQPEPNVEVYVYEPGTTNEITVYEDEGVTPITQPILTDSQGRYAFFVDVASHPEIRIYLEKEGVDFSEVNEDLDGVPVPGAGSTFIALTDTPSSYSGRGGHVVLVKTTEDGIETQPWPVTGTTLNFFLSDDAADIGSYYYMYPTESGDGYSELTSPSLSAGDDQLLWSFVTEAGEPGVDQLALGAYTATLFLRKSGNKNVRIYWKLFKRDTGGTETEILQSAVSDYLTADNSQYLVSAYLNEDQALDTTDRLVLKLYANVSGTGSDVTITLTMEGDYDSRLTINVLSSAFNLDRLSDVTITSPSNDELLAYDSGSGKWINQTPGEAGVLAADGTVPLVADWDVGGYSINNVLSRKGDGGTKPYEAYATEFPGTDIGAKVNAAFDAGYTVVRLPAGTWTYSTTILVPADCALIGAGMNSTTLNYTGDTAAIALKTPTADSNYHIVLKEFKLDGSGAASGTIGIDFKVVNQSLFERIHIQSFPSHGFKIDATAPGETAHGATKNTFLEVRSAGNGGHGLLLTGELNNGECNVNRIIGGQFNSNANSGIAIYVGVLNTIINPVCSYNDKSGIFIDHYGNAVINPYTEGNANYSVSLGSSATGCIVLLGRRGEGVNNSGQKNIILIGNTTLRFSFTDTADSGIEAGVVIYDDSKSPTNVFFYERSTGDLYLGTSGGKTKIRSDVLEVPVHDDTTRPAPGTAGRIIFNTTDGNLNIDDGTNWILPDGTVT